MNMNNLTVYITENITLLSAILTLLVSLGIGIVFSGYYALTKKDIGFDRSFITTLIIIPIVVSMLIMMVSNDLVTAISLGGIFVLMRFRTIIKNTKDAALLLTVIGLSYASGLGLYKYVLIVGLFILFILVILHIFKLDHSKKDTFRLQILVSEELDYVGLFDAIFKEYLVTYTLKKAKVTDFGTLIELTYFVKMKDPTTQKKFIDALRIKNGNLNIILADDYDKLVEVSK